MVDWDACTKTQLYAYVLSETKAYLDSQLVTAAHSTLAIIEQLYPKKTAIFAKQEYTRSVLFKALSWHAQRDLKAYCTRGPGQPGKRQYAGKTVYPLVWHGPKAAIICSECGREYYK